MSPKPQLDEGHTIDHDLRNSGLICPLNVERCRNLDMLMSRVLGADACHKSSLTGEIMDIESGVWIRSDSGLAPLRPLLKAWIEKSLAYCKCHKFEDNGWWYNERASLSILAAAAWSLKGWCALEEYSTTKRGNVPADESEAPASRRGRADLWVGGRTGYAIEAKQAWQSIGARSSGKNSNVWEKFQDALRDAGDLTSDAADRRIGALFVAAYLPVSQVRVELSDRIDREKVAASVSAWFNALSLKSKPRVRAYSWVFPTKMDKFISDNGKNLVPGTLMILGQRGRANRRSRLTKL